MMALQRWQAQLSLHRARLLAMVLGVLGAALMVGFVATREPMWVIAAELAGILALLILARPDIATLLVIVILYSNAAVIAVRINGVPEFIGAATPALLIIPLASYMIFRREKLVMTRTLPVIFLFLIVQVIGTVFAENSIAAVNTLIVFLTEGIGLYFLLTNAVRTPTMLRRVTWTLLIVGAVLGGMSLYQDVTKNYSNTFWGFAQLSNAAFNTGAQTIAGEVTQRRLAGPVGEQNRYAQIMLMLVPLGLFRFLGERTFLLRLLAGICTGLIAMGMILTFSRGAAIGFGLVLVIMVFLRYIKPWQIAVVVVGVALLLQAVPEYRTRLVSIEGVGSILSGDGGSNADGSIRSRVTEGMAALLVFIDHPLIGVGPGGFRYYYQDYAELVGLRVLAADRQAHNLYLGLAAEAGLLGIGCFFAILAVSLRGLAQTRRRLLQSNPDLANLATGFFLAIVAYLTTGMFLHFAFIRYFWLILALADAVVYVASIYAPETKPDQAAPAAVPALPPAKPALAGGLLAAAALPASPRLFAPRGEAKTAWGTFSPFLQMREGPVVRWRSGLENVIDVTKHQITASVHSVIDPPLRVAREVVRRAKQSVAGRQIRGSSLLLVGRTLSMGINFVVQVLIVRYLTGLDPSKATYGAFTYVLSLVAMGETIVTLGLDRAITRFVPIYHERHEYGKLFGTIIMVVGTILSLGLALILLVYGLQGWIGQSLISDGLAVPLLLIMVGLSPVQALDGLLSGLFATFAGPRAIFFRKHVLAPGLKLIVVLMLVFGGSDVFFLASGYLFAGALGVSIYSVILWRALRDQGLFKHFNLREIKMPAAEVFAFTIPLLTSDLVYVLMNTSDAILLEHFRGTADVAAFRAVQPAAGLNQLVISSFTLLFTPMAARLFARDDRAGLNALYWQTAIWMALLSFPIFITTFSLAQPLTVILYGAAYSDSGIILALLSLGYYFSAALGFNGLTLKVFGKLRFIVIGNLLAALVNVGINLLLIPRYGALGAAIGTCGTMIAHNILKQAGLALGTGIRLFDWHYLKIYITIVVSALALLAAQAALGLLIAPGTYLHFGIGLVLAGLASLFVLLFNRRALQVGQTFPELLRIPLVRRLLGK